MESWDHTLNEGLDPANLRLTSPDLVWWNCGVHGAFQAKVRSRARAYQPTGCQKCALEAMRQSKITPVEGNSLAEVAPEVAESWHVELNGSLTPRDLAAGSRHKAWWTCPTHGPWQAAVVSRALKGHGCRKCSFDAKALKASTPQPGRSLADRRPDMAAQWHPTLNGDLTPKDVLPGSRKVVWWDCPDHGPWQQSLNVRYSQGCGCPPCGVTKIKAANLAHAARKKAAAAA